MKDIIIIGNSLGAEILYGYLSADSRYNVVGFAVDAQYIAEQSLFDLNIFSLETLVDKFPPNSVSVVLGVGYSGVNANRAELYNRVKEMGYSVETYIHPTATVMPSASIGEGVVVLASSVIEPFAQIGNNSFVWCNCTVAHHAKIGDHVWIASNTVISGQTEVANGTFIGVGAVISNKVHIAEKNIIGGSAFLTRDTKINEVWLARSSEKHRFDAENYAKYFL
ncbi:MAG: hypothetical protein BA863_18870 [Desulfovibrio sp. S3730MH75]|nr:MAG: hypothetical protein BA863_18870 [Desulfovibrio sp. S3730MH75]